MASLCKKPKTIPEPCVVVGHLRKRAIHMLTSVLLRYTTMQCADYCLFLESQKVYDGRLRGLSPPRGSTSRLSRRPNSIASRVQIP
jgi:hypothetical protein